VTALHDDSIQTQQTSAGLREAQHLRVEWLQAHPDEERYLAPLGAGTAEVDDMVGRREEAQDSERERREEIGLGREQAIINRSPRRRFEQKLAEEDERVDRGLWRVLPSLSSVLRR
jgi:hypothetical protein